MGPCSVVTETVVRTPPLRVSTRVPVMTSGSPWPSHLTSNGDPYGRCSAIHRGCATTSRLSPVAVLGTRRYRSRTVLVDPTPPSRRDGSDVARRGRTIRRSDSPKMYIAADPQLRHRRLFEVEHHPVRETMRFQPCHSVLASLDHWLRSPSPTLGRDNDSVLEELGYSHPQRRIACTRWATSVACPRASDASGARSLSRGASSEPVFTTMPPPLPPSGSRPYQRGPNNLVDEDHLFRHLEASQ